MSLFSVVPSRTGLTKGSFLSRRPRFYTRQSGTIVAAERLMELKVDARTGARHGERSPDRLFPR